MLLKGFVLRGTLLSACLLAFISQISAANLVHRYSFTADASDSVGTEHGTLLGGAAISGGAVILNGSGAYVDLPNGLVSSLSSITIETWLTDNSSGTWSRIFDFGNSTGGEDVPGSGTQYFFLSPQAGGGQLRLGITVGTGEQNVDWAGTRLPTVSLKHVVWTLDGGTQTSRLFVDGVQVGENLALTLTPANLGFTVNNWIGRSQFAADPYLNADITEFRIYDGALTPTEVQQSFAYGPDVAAFSGPVTIISQPQSQTVTELMSVSLTVQYGGTQPVSVQWLRNNQPIPGATNETYTMPSVALTNHNAAYRATLTNTYNSSTYTAATTNAVLTVNPDTTPPALVRAASSYPNEVVVTYSEGVRADTATNTAHYVITRVGGSLGVTGARFGASAAEVILTTAAQTLGTEYLVTINGVRDLATAANLIATNSQTNFIASPFLSVDIGNPATGGTLTPVTGGVDVSASGSGISGTSDQFTFGLQNRTNNFDIVVRVDALEYACAWTRAGLMAREGVASNAPFAASFSTPGPAGCHFESRSAIGGSAAMAGTFPANYPDTWLRLRRVGNVFDGFASLDGQSWEFLGSTTIAMSNVVQVGLALTAGSASDSTTAQFRDYAGGGGGTIATNSALPFELLGPSSRRTPLVISEIMYNPPDAWGGTNNLEFVELWNSGLITEDLTGHKLTGGVSYQFPNGTQIAPGQFLLVANDPVAAQSYYGAAFLGPYTNKLSNSGGTLRLLNELGGRLLEVEYDNKSPWPVSPDGAGHSLVLSRPSYGENDPRAWTASDVIGGSAGAFEHYGSEPARGVVINEFLAHTDLPQVDYIELFNTTTQSVNLSGAWLSDETGTNKFQIPNGTSLAARGFLAYTETQLGFALSADGEKIILINSNLTCVLDAVSFDGQMNGVSSGRYPNGAPGFQPLSTSTPGASNTPPRLSQLVINEIMYHPISESDEDEYFEIYNRGPGVVALAGWKLQGGVGFTFPSNAVIAAGGYVVVAENLTNLLAKYPQLNGTNAFGNYSGALANGGERIALAMPDDLVSTNGQGVVTSNIFYIVMDEVTYADGGRWGKWSDGGGSSLELTDPHADNRLPANWADSDESAKAAWTTIDVTSIVENGQVASQGTPNRFELFLQDDGEVLVDNLEFRSNGGANLIPNGSFDSGVAGWTFGGVMRQSFAQPGVGIGGSQALHVVSTGRGDAGPNKARITMTSSAVANPPNTGTIRGSVRWLKGSPFVLLRLRGHWMEVSRRLNLPDNCGTPGLPNSRLLPNAGPAIFDVTHAPVLPAAGQSVVVSARASDPDSLNPAFLVLRYRLDPSTTYSLAPMFDNGVGNDALAGDGIYSGTIPGQAAGALAAFYITATDTLSAASQFPAQAPTRECLVRWGETPVAGSIGTYRLWVTEANVNQWTSREKNANDPLDATFVYGNTRVIYNVDTLYSGSPFHSPNYNGPVGSFACDYEINFHSDERFLGSEPFVLSAFDVVSGNFFFNDDSAQVDLTGTWIGRQLGQPYNYRRHIHMFLNGLRRGTIYDDAQQPNSEMLAEYFPNDVGGQLRKIEDWFEFADNGQDFTYTTATIDRFNQTGGGIDAKRYRWNWRPRATDDPDEWPPFTSLVAAVNYTGTPDYEAQVRTWMDVPNFLRPIITHHVCGSWDSYAYQRGKNMYAYQSAERPWRLLLWDIELSLGAGGNSSTDSIYNMHDGVLRNLILNNPAFNREYLRGFQEAVDGPLQPGAADAILDERYASFQLNNVPLISPQFIKNFIAARRSYLLTVLPNAAFGVNNPAYQVVSGSNVLALTGTGPLSVEEVLINGVPYPITWTSTTAWRVLVPLSAGTNVLALSARDRYGNLIAGATGNVTANFTGGNVAPEGNVVLNEILYQPATNGAGFVELFNAHSTFSFDLTGWSINGLDYNFPPGATLPPRAYLVLAKDTFAFSQANGITNFAFDQFNGNLDGDGETLTLLRPDGLTNSIVVDRVRYETTAPWPPPTNGVSLQLVDAAQDNSRVANWGLASAPANPPPSPLALMAYGQSWRYNQTANLDGVNWTSPAYNDAAWPSGPGLLAFESNGSITPLIGTTLADPRTGSGLTPGHAYYFRTTLVLSNSPVGYTFTVGARIDDGAVFYVNGVEVQRVRMSPSETITNRSLATASPPTSSDALVDDVFDIPASAFALGTNVIAVGVHQSATNSSDIVFGLQLNATYAGVSPATPGNANNITATLPAFPPLWLNELQANNVTGPLDNFGQRDPWSEIFNTASTNVSLTGYYLTDTYTNLTKWAFPAGRVASNGFNLVWCDNQTGQTSATSLHAGLSLASGNGSLALTRIINGTTQVVDYLNYASLPANWSYGDVPDAQPFYRRTMFYTTPGATNSGASAPLNVFINEWLADNTITLADPADGQFEDWFELYNPGTNAADVGGYYLTDNLTNKFQYLIPNNGHYVIPPGGYLLVWADNEDNQNSTNRADLHADFALGKGGESIGLFAADGTTIDAVSFGAQTSDVSEGRFPNGAANVYSMPTPTPRAGNIVPNTPPTLASITNRYLTLGQTLSLTFSATDTDAPPQTLTYSLISPPAGAQIGSTSGVLTWTPFAAPATNNITVRVADNATPSLSATQSFTVTVVVPPTLDDVSLLGNNLSFSWMSVPGQYYQVEYKNDLSDPAWLPAGAVQLGTGGLLNFTNSISDSPRRFFRLRVLTGDQAMLLPPPLNGQAQGGHQFVLSWPTLPGQRFQVQATTNVALASWSDVGNPLTGTGELLKYTNDFTDAPRKFYRLALLK